MCSESGNSCYLTFELSRPWRQGPLVDESDMYWAVALTIGPSMLASIPVVEEHRRLQIPLTKRPDEIEPLTHESVR